MLTPTLVQTLTCTRSQVRRRQGERFFKVVIEYGEALIFEAALCHRGSSLCGDDLTGRVGDSWITTPDRWQVASVGLHWYMGFGLRLADVSKQTFGCGEDGTDEIEQESDGDAGE